MCVAVYRWVIMHCLQYPSCEYNENANELVCDVSLSVYIAENSLHTFHHM